MGLGIAQVFAQRNFKVVLYDYSDAQLDKARQTIAENFDGAITRGKMTIAEKESALSSINFTPNFMMLKADIVIEAIVESIEIKKELFHKLAEINSTQAILASNTSSISITQIAQGVSNPSRVAGLHFFNPAHIMKLVEIISGAETSEEVINTLQALVRDIGKTPVLCKDSPGFIVNRVARHYYVEALKAAEERVANIETIDTLMESAGFKLGPFKLMDLVGNDINFAVTSSLFDSFYQEAKFRPSRLQKQKVDAGHLGKKTKKGFYTYD